MRRVTLHDDLPVKAPRAKSATWIPALYRNGKFVRIDKRSREGILLKRTTDALLEQLNRRPTPAERILIDRLSWLHLCIQSLDHRVIAGKVGYDEAASYATHIKSFSLGLVNLGLLGNSTTLPRLDDLSLTDQERAARYPARAQTLSSVEGDDDASNDSR